MKHNLHILIISIFFLLSACVTNSGGYKETEQIEAAVIGLSADQLQELLGKPRYIRKIPPEHQLWYFLDQPDGFSGGNCELNIYFYQNYVVKVTMENDGKPTILFPLDACRNLLDKLPPIVSEP